MNKKLDGNISNAILICNIVYKIYINAFNTENNDCECDNDKIITYLYIKCK